MRVVDPALRGGAFLDGDVVLERLDRARLVAGVAQAEPEAVVGLGLVGREGGVAPVGGDRARALPETPARDG
jgi:hypothetical protein